jgi:glutathione S-transferase
VRTVWSQILALAARLGDVLPRDLHDRVATTGLIHEIAGEDGLGWNARLMMIHAGFTTNGARGFAPPAAKYLAAKYGYEAERIPAARARAIEVLTALGERLGGATYFGGDRPNALDAYVATFVTPLREISEADCPSMQPAMRAGFAPAADELGPHVPPSLVALRARMFERHLEWPIAI